MIHNPIHKVLSTFQNSNARFLLMGGQACILYGAAEFSRDTDLVVLATEENLSDIRAALSQLKAKQVFLPPLQTCFLERGHACHFQSQHPDCRGSRVDMMSRMRGCASFEILWERKTMLSLPHLEQLPVLSLPDLVLAKKSQRDKDWPIVRRLIEIDFMERRNHPPPQAVQWWLAESRTPSHLKWLGERYPEQAQQVPSRPWLKQALDRGEHALRHALELEEARIREEDRAYWIPLKAELEAMRHGQQL